MIKKTKTALGLVAVLGAAVLTSAPVSADQISDLNARIAKLEGAEAVRSAASDDGNMVFFRGGYARSAVARGGFVEGGDGTLGVSYTADQDAWYVGAGFDFSLSDDLFGLHDGTEVLAELMFSYAEFDTSPSSLLNTGTVAFADAGVITSNIPATVSQFTLTAAPKIKFMKGSKFRPWVSPIGLGMHVISPTSNSVTYLKPSMVFAGGADYNVWKNIYVGADIRYTLGIAGASNSEINVDTLTVGGYLGIGF